MEVDGGGTNESLFGSRPLVEKQGSWFVGIVGDSNQDEPIEDHVRFSGRVMHVS